MKKVLITQSNYIPWRGYFHNIRECSHLVLLDDVQFTRRDWRNRNQIKTAQGKKWLSIPVASKGQYQSLRVCEAQVSDPQWAEKHLGIIRQAYRGAPCFADVFGFLEALYKDASSLTRLSDINRLFIERICEYLGIRTQITWSWDHFPLEELQSFDRSERLLALCRAVGGTDYLSGPAAKAYMVPETFDRAGIRLHWADYGSLSAYPQLHGDFDNAVSIVDTLMMTGGM